jgi:hypothetical protein
LFRHFSDKSHPSGYICGANMKLDNVLELFVGLSLTFGCISLIVSTITEAIAAVTQWRSKTLLSGLKKLLNDPNLSGLALGILNHAAANPMFVYSQQSGSKPSKPSVLPSYIEPRAFASALLDTIQNSGTPLGQASEDLRTAIQKLPDEQLRPYLLGVYDRANGDLDKIRDDVASWFNSSMDRLSGIYKRYALLVSFLTAFLLAALMNVAAFHIARTLWSMPAISVPSVMPANGDYGSLITPWLRTFPFGWTLSDLTISLAPLGWLITALATLFGAPFWFDILQRVVQVRATGPTPGEARRKAS